MSTITMVCSGHDGVGKSTSTVFLADALAVSGKKVLILELDSGSRCQDILCGIPKVPFDLLDVLAGRCSVSEGIAVSPSHENVYVLPGCLRQGSVNAKEFQSLCRILGDRFDYVLMDTACMNGTTHAACSVAQNALLFCTADPFSIRDSKIKTEQLHAYGMDKIRLVINRLVRSRVEAGIVGSLDDVIDGVGVRLIAVVPESPEIAYAAAMGFPLVANTSEYEIFSRFARRLHGEDVPLLIQ